MPADHVQSSKFNKPRKGKEWSGVEDSLKEKHKLSQPLLKNGALKISAFFLLIIGEK